MPCVSVEPATHVENDIFKDFFVTTCFRMVLVRLHYVSMVKPIHNPSESSRVDVLSPLTLLPPHLGSSPVLLIAPHTDAIYALSAFARYLSGSIASTTVHNTAVEICMPSPARLYTR